VGYQKFTRTRRLVIRCPLSFCYTNKADPTQDTRHNDHPFSGLGWRGCKFLQPSLLQRPDTSGTRRDWIFSRGPGRCSRNCRNVSFRWMGHDVRICRSTIRIQQTGRGQFVRHFQSTDDTRRPPPRRTSASSPQASSSTQTSPGIMFFHIHFPQILVMQEKKDQRMGRGGRGECSTNNLCTRIQEFSRPIE